MRRRFLFFLLAMITVPASASTPVPTSVSQAGPEDDTSTAWRALSDGAIVLFRHALAPGTGDPADFRIGDCTTQRNLDQAGREQARRIGNRLQERKIRVRAVWTSQWCRTRETAQLLDLGPVRDEPAFNSFFADRKDEPEQTALARRLLQDWKGPGVLVVVTHQVNMTALTGVYPRSGEGVVVRPARNGIGLDVMGRVLP